MVIVSWLFDKLGYMPKISVDTTWPFPATQQDYTPHKDEVKPKPAAKKTVAKKKVATKKTVRKKA